MKKNQIAYTALMMIAVGAALYGALISARPHYTSGEQTMLLHFVVTVVLITLFRSFPLWRDAYQPAYVACGLAVVLAVRWHVLAAMVAYLVGGLCTLTRDPHSGQLRWRWLVSPLEALLLDSSVLAAIYLGSILYAQVNQVTAGYLSLDSLVALGGFSAALCVLTWVFCVFARLFGTQVEGRSIAEGFMRACMGTAITAAVALLLLTPLATPAGMALALLALLLTLWLHIQRDLLKQAHLDARRGLESLVAEVEQKIPYLQGHGHRVGICAIRMARAMGYKHRQIAHLREAALLADVGMVGIDDLLLHKELPLQESDWVQMRRHVEKSCAILADTGIDEETATLVRQHHERYDGQGYPEHLRGDAVQLPAAILAVADAYVAMTSERPYRSAMGRERAAKELRKAAGTQFHPQAVEALLRCLESL